MSTDVNKDVLYGLEKLHVDAIKKYAPPQGSWLPPDEALFGSKMIFNVFLILFCACTVVQLLL